MSEKKTNWKDPQKWLQTMRVFDSYEKRIAQARITRQLRLPWDPDVKEQIIQETKQLLKYEDSLIPVIRNMEVLSQKAYDTYRVDQLRFTSWNNCWCSASLYLPYVEAGKKLPLVFLCCGHGAGGRLAKTYLAMAHLLASLGMAVFVPDNMGQGDREPFGHWDVVAPFYCGLTLQGMIVMETIAMIQYLSKDPRFDANRLAACGNSGGGTLTLFLAALAPELSVLASSGYPSEFPYIFEKERKHCACNLLPGAAYGPEMWEIYSMFAPKPLLLEQGLYDDLIPVEYNRRTARKVQNTYLQLGAEDQFRHEVTKTRHSWDTEDLQIISTFLAEHLMNPSECAEAQRRLRVYAEPEDIYATDDLHVTFPDTSLSTEEVAEALSGIHMPSGTQLHHVYPPTFQGEPLNESAIAPDVGRGDVLRVFAQMECFLENTRVR